MGSLCQNKNLECWCFQSSCWQIWWCLSQHECSSPQDTSQIWKWNNWSALHSVMRIPRIQTRQHSPGLAKCHKAVSKFRRKRGFGLTMMTHNWHARSCRCVIFLHLHPQKDHRGPNFTSALGATDKFPTWLWNATRTVWIVVRQSIGLEFVTSWWTFSFLVAETRFALAGITFVGNKTMQRQDAKSHANGTQPQTTAGHPAVGVAPTARSCSPDTTSRCSWRWLVGRSQHWRWHPPGCCCKWQQPKFGVFSVVIMIGSIHIILRAIDIGKKWLSQRIWSIIVVGVLGHLHRGFKCIFFLCWCAIIAIICIAWTLLLVLSWRLWLRQSWGCWKLESFVSGFFCDGNFEHFGCTSQVGACKVAMGLAQFQCWCCVGKTNALKGVCQQNLMFDKLHTHGSIWLSFFFCHFC